MNALASFRYDALFDYHDKLDGEEAKKTVRDHYNRLMETVQPDLKRENKKRLANGDLTYPYFLPSWMPNGIQT